MLSLARYRHIIWLQLFFVGANAFGVLLGMIYNASTPDLYPNNAHHKIGWIATAVVVSQFVIGAMGKLAEWVRPQSGSSHSGSENVAFIPVSTENMAEHQRLHNSRYSPSYRLSNDSGQGTEPNTESLRSHSVSTAEEEPMRPRDADKEYENEDEDLESVPLPSTPTRRRGAYVAKVANLVASPVWRFFRLVYAIIDRTILILGFITLCTGIITYGRFFVRIAKPVAHSCRKSY